MKTIKRLFKKLFGWIPGSVICLLVFVAMFGYLGYRMGTANMLNTIMNTAHDLLLKTVFYLMAICVLTGAIGKIFVEFGVVNLLEKLFRPLMKPLFNLPGVASLGAVMTFLSDNPAIISLAQDKKFASYFKKYQFISLNNFGTSFGMGLLVIVFMVGQGYFLEPFVGFIGAMIGCIVSTRLMQYFVLKAYPRFKEENAAEFDEVEEERDVHSKKPVFLRILDSLLDGGRTGVDVGMMIIPGVLVISTVVMVFTFGPDTATGQFTGAAKEGVELLPWIGEKMSFVFEWLFGFTEHHLIAFPITAVGAVGAALGLVPDFAEKGWIDGNAIAVFTAIGMCWSGFLSTHTAMLDALGYRRLTSKDILSHTIGGLVAGVAAHWMYVLISVLFLSSSPTEQKPALLLVDGETVTSEWVADASEWTAVQADSLLDKAPDRNVVYRTVDVETTEYGALIVNLKSEKNSDNIRFLGVDIVDADGNGITANYVSATIDDSLGYTYTLENVPVGKHTIRYFVDGGCGSATSSGTITLGLVSQKRVLASLLEEAKHQCEMYMATKEQAMSAALLKLLCDKYEKLLDDPDATDADLHGACAELAKVIK